MTKFDYDLFVIGAGSGGVRAARMASQAGARVAIAEDRYLGGTCVNVGCIPKKLLVYGAHFAEDFEDAAAFGWSVRPDKFDWPTMIANKNHEISRLNGVYGRLLANAGVTLIEARATVTGANAVRAGDRVITAERILVATGGWPVVPDIPGKAHAITSNEAFYLEDLRSRVIVVGGGYIAVEFAGIFNGFGAETIQLYRGPLFLRGFDDDVRRALAEEMPKKGVDLRFNANIAHIDKMRDGTLRAKLENGDEIDADLIMYATGRKPNTAKLGLKEVGVELDTDGAIKVNESFQSSVPSIYALGDVIDRMALTPVAIAEAMVLVNNLYKGGSLRMDYDNVPSAVFSQPPIGTVGLTEAAARKAYPAVDIYRSTFRALKHTLTGRDEETMMKLIVDRASDRVLGLHMVGPDAGEIVQGFAVALIAGATKAQFDATVGIHPTSAEEFVTMREPVPAVDRQAAE